jgi:2,4-dienoyl-CoA reductase-like NADH-dependent reductase (Old Yellow Enzyme family)
VRRAVGPRFPVGIKLNASDFQKGGFTNAECLQLVHALNGVGLDLLELSGGSLEQPKVVGVALTDEGEDGARASAVTREGYFIAFAGAVREVAAMPVMVTGGFRSAAGMVDALDGGDLDVVGVGRPLISDPQAARRLLAGELDQLPTPALREHGSAARASCSAHARRRGIVGENGPEPTLLANPFSPFAFVDA